MILFSYLEVEVQDGGHVRPLWKTLQGQQPLNMEFSSRQMILTHFRQQRFLSSLSRLFKKNVESDQRDL